MSVKPYYEDEASGIVIFHGRAEVIVPQLGRHDLLLTDPPYGIGACAGIGKYGRLKIDADDPRWDESPPPRWLLEMILESADRHIIWGGNYFDLPQSRQYLIWDKGAGFRGRDFAECEMAWCSTDGNAKVFSRDPLACRDYAEKMHPTQKPIALMNWCIHISGDVQTIIDPFAGVGTTGVAAKLSGKRATLIEVNERYCEIAASRLQQGVLFGVDNPSSGAA